MALKKIGYGIFSWSVDERRTNRYGSFHLANESFSGNDHVTVELNRKALDQFLRKRVRLVCEVVESRASGHIGDMFLGVKPSQPPVGEKVEVGVGLLDIELCEWEKTITEILLRPGDARNELWIDPRKLYRLHDQTVGLYVELTDDDFSPKTDLTTQAPGMISNGDGSFQVKQLKSDSVKILPKVERMGGGMFILSNDHKEGERIEIIEEFKK